MGLAHKLLGPTIAPQNPSIRLPGWKGGFWQTRALNMAHLVQPRIYVSGFPPVRKLAGFQGISFNLLVIYSCRLAVPDAPLMNPLYEVHLCPAAHLIRWGNGTDASFFFRFFWKLECI